MNEPAIICESLSKLFTLSDGSTFTALKDINFTIERGSFTGVVGRNGCGKTTLLKIMAGITRPTSGTVKIYGTALSILDVGAGFYPDMTGVENIFLVGKQFGLSKDEINSIVDDILSFSEIEQYKDQPVKHYSQGMYLRLAMSLLLQLKADIYLFDEVTAVGDDAFRKKCFYKIRQMASSGSTFVLVSHNYNEIAALCDRCLVLSSGQITGDGHPEAVYDRFRESLIGKAQMNADVPTFKTIAAGYVDIEEFSIRTAQGEKKNSPLTQSSELEFVIKWHKVDSNYLVIFHIDILDDMGRLLINTANVYGKQRTHLEKQNDKGRFIDTCAIPGYFLNTGVYRAQLNVTVYFDLTTHQKVIESETPLKFEIHNFFDAEMTHFWTFSPSPVRTAFNWSRKG